MRRHFIFPPAPRLSRDVEPAQRCFSTMSDSESVVSASAASSAASSAARQGNPLYRFCFTCHVADEKEGAEKVDSMKAFLKRHGKKWVFQLERGEQGGYHFQGAVGLKERQRLTALARFFTDAGLQSHLSPAYDRSASELYCLKKDTRVLGPWASFELPIEVEEEAYDGADLPKNLYRWQAKVRDYCTGPVNDREILWLWDPEGSKGKSSFTKYMVYHHKAATFAWSDTKHTLYRVASTPASRIYIFDLTRSKPTEYGQEDLYSALESIKNGLVQSAMYTSPMKVFAPPHVIVFANFEPNRAQMSADRFSVHRVVVDAAEVAARLVQPRFEGF